jgi:endonuclease/exonuclease/phosphatase family metal-dependent hydrolase
MPRLTGGRPGMPAEQGGVRVVSWNVHGWRDDPAAVRRGLRALQPDLVCLQEVYRGPGPWPWGSGTRRGLAAVGRECGLQLVAGGMRAAGNAVLASPRLTVERSRALRMPTPLLGPGRSWPALRGIRVPAPRIGERRGVVLVELTAPGAGRLLLACTHLDLESELRVRQAERVVELLRSWGAGVDGPPAVVAGDLNELPDGPAWTVLDQLAADRDPGGAATYSAAQPRQRIDAVLVGLGLAVVGYQVGGIDPQDARRASDHLPVVADLALPG